MASVMACSGCGAEPAPDDRFCARCGRQLPAPPPPTDSPAASSRQPEEPGAAHVWTADPSAEGARPPAMPPGYTPRPWDAAARPGGGGWRPRSRPVGGPGDRPGEQPGDRPGERPAEWPGAWTNEVNANEAPGVRSSAPPPAPGPSPPARGLAGSGRPAPPARGPAPGEDRPTRPPVTGPVPSEAGTTTVEGQVRGIQVRSEYRGESQSEVIWTFRIERYDSAGNRILLLPVEMRGLTFEGSVSDGDWVRSRGKMKHGTLRVKQLENLTTGAAVQSKGLSKAMLILVIVFFAAILAWLAWIAISLITADSGPPPGFPEDT